MKVLIAYYSQTGNTKKIADALGRGAAAVCEQVDVLDVRDVDVRKVREYDLVGLGSPAIGAEADIVKRFIYAIPLTGGQHCFCFNTHGSLPFHYFPIATRHMVDREFQVIGWKGWFSTVNIQCFPSPYYTDGHPDDIDLAEAEEFAKIMVDRSKRIYAGETDLLPELPPLEPPKPYKLTHGGVVEEPGVHGDRQYDPSKCLYPNCHICMDNCPEQFINHGEGKYGSRGSKCTINECCLCEMLCPTGAITITKPDLQYGLDFLKGAHGFFEATLDRCEKATPEDLYKLSSEYAYGDKDKTGDFRRKVPVDQIGWDTMWIDVHAQRPHLKQVPRKKKAD